MAARFVNSFDIHDTAKFQVIPEDYFLPNQPVFRIRRELDQLKGSHRYIEDAYVLFPLSNTEVTAVSLHSMTEFDRICATDTAFYTGFPLIESGTKNIEALNTFNFFKDWLDYGTNTDEDWANNWAFWCMFFGAMEGITARAPTPTPGICKSRSYVTIISS